MHISILGTGGASQALGAALLKLGHAVTLGTRDVSGEAAQKWTAHGASARVATFAEAAQSGELVIVGLKGEVAEDVVKQIGPAPFVGKVVIDMTNALKVGPTGPELFVGGTDSLGERIQRALAGAHVVKTFNHYSLAVIASTPFSNPKGDLFMAGNDAAAKAKVAELIVALGWDAVDIGDLRGARYLEGLAMITIIHAFGDGNWGIAYKMLGRKAK